MKMQKMQAGKHESMLVLVGVEHVTELCTLVTTVSFIQGNHVCIMYCSIQHCQSTQSKIITNMNNITTSIVNRNYQKINFFTSLVLLVITFVKKIICH